MLDNMENDPIYWAMLFDFGRVRMAKGDLVVASMWRTNYYRYIASDFWKAKANIARRQADYRCQLCNNDKHLHVHHRTYERLGKELSSDLITLCSNCHEKFHDKGKFNGE